MAAFLRLYRLGHSPPGLHVDEAGNAWNSWCLLRTGHDAWGARWPVFYTRCFGENRSALMLYAILPFEALLGISAVAARLAGAAAGILAVVLAYVVGRRLEGPATGLVAAAALALEPWAVQHGRWAHESALCPALVLVPLALLGAAGLPVAGPSSRARPWLAGLAGATAGLACYGYPAVRIFLPLLLIATVAVNARSWLELSKSRSSRLAVGAAALGGALTLGPLLYVHLTDPAITKAPTWVWSAGDGLAVRVAKVLSRYPGHFSPGFLFRHGTQAIDVSPPPGYGLFHAYEIPLLLAGLAFALANARSSHAARFLLAAAALYPAGDLLAEHASQNVLRCLPGLPGLVLLEAWGAIQLFRWLSATRPRYAKEALAVAAAFVLFSNARFLTRFFGAYDSEKEKFFAFQVDLGDALERNRARIDAADAVVCTSIAIVHPYVQTLVGLRYDPARWLAEPKDVVTGPLPNGDYNHSDVVTRYGKLSFLFPGLPLPPALRSGDGTRRTVFIVRPGELGLEKRFRPVDEIRSPDGEPVLRVFDQVL